MSETKKPALIPANLAALVECTAKESTRYAMTGVHLTIDHETNGYVAVATTSKILAVVTGTGDDPADFPEIKELTAAPNGATSALIPSAAWKENLKPIHKGSYKPILKNTAIVLGENCATFGRTNLDVQQVQSTRLVDGRFPPYKEILPKKPAPHRVLIDPELMMKLLKTAAAFTDDETQRIELSLTDSTKPITVKTKNGKGQVFTGLIMPMSKPKQSREEELAETNAARLQEQAGAMLAAIRKAYQQLRDIPQTDTIRRELADAYDAARPENDQTYSVQVFVDPSIETTPNLTRIPKTITATCSSAAYSEIGRLCRAIEIDNKLERGRITAQLEEMPDESAIDYQEPALNILDDTDDDLAALQECTVSD